MSVTQTWMKCQNAQFNAQWELGTGLISVHGELDAANADHLADYVARCVKRCRWLILDLSDLEFIGTAGFSALHRINVACTAADSQWAMVPGRAVSRLLRICDPDGTLPTTASAKQPLPDHLPLLELVSEPS